MKFAIIGVRHHWFGWISEILATIDGKTEEEARNELANHPRCVNAKLYKLVE